MADNKNCLTLASGFAFDYKNIYGVGKITNEDFFALADEIGDAHNAVCKIRTTGEAKMHLSKDGVPELVLFPQLPYVKEGNLNNPKSIQRLKEFGESLKYNVEIAISFGIGGSYLGNKVLFDVHCGEFWNAKSQEERCGYPEFYFSGNNIDPRRTGELINYVLGKAKQKYLQSNEQTKIALIVISKSGSTIDTMSNFMVAYEKFCKSEYIMLEVVAVTDPAEGANETLLKKLAKEEKWQTFSVPDGVGGRFSIFSEVGLVTAACIGFDIDEFLAGAKNMDQACQTADFYQNPALLNATLKYLAAKKFDRNIEVLMPYADNLKSTSEWYVQLLAESLGKRVNRSGSSVYYGRTPIVAVGTTDMHAQTQQHQDGAKDKVVQFIKIAEWDNDLIIPDVFPKVSKLSDISTIKMSAALEVALNANALALISDNRFNATLILPKLNAFHLGELLYFLALSVAYEGELANVNAYDQPGVEAYKRIMSPNLKRIKEQV